MAKTTKTAFDVPAFDIAEFNKFFDFTKFEAFKLPAFDTGAVVEAQRRNVEVLTAAGHGPRRTSSVVSALGDVPLVDGLKRCKDLRRQCLACAENAPEVRLGASIDCPVWPYRMGKNPHNPRRGINPFVADHVKRMKICQF